MRCFYERVSLLWFCQCFFFSTRDNALMIGQPIALPQGSSLTSGNCWSCRRAQMTDRCAVYPGPVSPHQATRRAAVASTVCSFFAENEEKVFVRLLHFDLICFGLSHKETLVGMLIDLEVYNFKELGCSSSHTPCTPRGRLYFCVMPIGLTIVQSPFTMYRWVPALSDFA